MLTKKTCFVPLFNNIYVPCKYLFFKKKLNFKIEIKIKNIERRKLRTKYITQLKKNVPNRCSKIASECPEEWLHFNAEWPNYSESTRYFSFVAS